MDSFRDNYYNILIKAASNATDFENICVSCRKNVKTYENKLKKYLKDSILEEFGLEELQKKCLITVDRRAGQIVKAGARAAGCGSRSQAIANLKNEWCVIEIAEAETEYDSDTSMASMASTRSNTSGQSYTSGRSGRPRSNSPYKRSSLGSGRGRPVCQQSSRGQSSRGRPVSQQSSRGRSSQHSSNLGSSRSSFEGSTTTEELRSYELRSGNVSDAEKVVVYEQLLDGLKAGMHPNGKPKIPIGG